jgi:hypothetical protein
MKTKYLRIFLVLLFFTLITAYSALPVGAQTDAGEKTPETNIIGEIKGDAKIIRSGKELKAQPEDEIIISDVIETDKLSSANVLFTDKSKFFIDEKTRITLEKYYIDEEKKQGTMDLFLSTGILKAVSGENDILINTPLSVASTKEADKQLNVVHYKNSDVSVTDTVRVTAGNYSCVVKDVPPQPPTVPVPVTERIVNKYGPFGALDFIVWETTTEGKPTFCVAIFEFEECDECEKLNPGGKCIPDNLKPCDDGDPCTMDDRCLGRVCRGKRDPSPIDPACELGGIPAP